MNDRSTLGSTLRTTGMLVGTVALAGALVAAGLAVGAGHGHESDRSAAERSAGDFPAPASPRP